MGQIVSTAAKPKRCNLNKLSQLGTPAAGEYILVSSDNSMNAAGQGNFDCYIEGDGQKAATELELKPIADVTPTSGSKNSVTSDGVWSSLFKGNITTEEITSTYTDTRVINGAYIDANGGIVSYDTYFYTKPFFVKSGSVVTLKIRANSVSYLNKATGADDAGPYTSLRHGTITPSTEVTYTATEDCWLVVSGEKFDAGSYYVRWQVLEEPTEKYLRRDEVSDEIQEGSASAVTSGAVYGLVGKTYNLLDSKYLNSVAGWEKTGEDEYTGTPTQLHNAWPAGSYYPIDGTIKENTAYNISLEWKTNDTGLTGNCVYFRIYYTDGTYNGVTGMSEETTWRKKVLVSDKTKTLRGLRFIAGPNNSASVSIRKLQLAEGENALSYVPYGTRPVDDVARANAYDTRFRAMPTSYDIEISDGAGKYINRDGSITIYEQYFISDPITLHKGERMTFHSKASGAANLAYYENGSYRVIIFAVSDKTIEQRFEADEDCQVVISGANEAILPYAIYGIDYATKREAEQMNLRITELEEREGGSGLNIENPYSNVEWDNVQLAQTHEHCYDEAKLTSSYNRGIRVIACSHYFPSTPRYPMSGWSSPYKDLHTLEEYKAGDHSYVDRTNTDSIPTITIGGNTINTDTIPQIANAERCFVSGYGGHCNILGLLWGSFGNAVCDFALTYRQSEEDKALLYQLRRDYSLESIEKFNDLLNDETMWQFGSQYAFGTINHCNSVGSAKNLLDGCPSIFKAMELFNQGYSAGWNDGFRTAYDSLLSQGYKIWGTAVVDWQGDWARWNFTTAAEKTEWQAKYDALSSAEQQQYGSAEAYYMQTGRYQFDRGANAILLPQSYNGLSVQDKAKEVIKAYIGGRYYMVGLGAYGIRVSVNGNTIAFTLSDYCDHIKVITATGSQTYSGTDTIYHKAKATDIFVRLEATWDDGDFVYTNPLFVSE
jgi:hypothetical protein